MAYHTLARQTATASIDSLQTAITNVNPQDLDEISAFRAIESLISNITFRTSELNHIINNKLDEIKEVKTTYSNQLIENLKVES